MYEIHEIPLNSLMCTYQEETEQCYLCLLLNAKFQKPIRTIDANIFGSQVLFTPIMKLSIL